MSSNETIEHVFRHEYGQLVASLLQRVGYHHLQSVEDAVQFALMQALNFWVTQGQPDNPTAWLYQVAYRKLISDFRDNRRREKILSGQDHRYSSASETEIEIPLKGEMTDSLLKMLFITCQEGVSIESRIVFTLKSLLGFSVREIALRLFITKANVYKRYARARKFLEKQSPSLEDFAENHIQVRLPTVLQIIYLLFTEGYLSSHSDLAIRKDLCQEAIRLGGLLFESRFGRQPETSALMALLHLHFARFAGRLDESGSLVLLEDQNRSCWDQNQISLGLRYLQYSSQGAKISRYHIEAGIAAEHCLAPSTTETKWDRIVSSYELLETLTPSPLIKLNKVIAISQWKGPQVALETFNLMKAPSWLAASYHWFMVKADLLARCEFTDAGREAAQEAIRLAPSEHVKALLYERFKLIL